MDLLSDILSNLKLEGSIYFRTSFTSPWSIRVPAYQRVSRFHFAHRGRCLVRVNPDKDAVLLEQGDLIIITQGASHTLFCEPDTEHPYLELEEVIGKSKYSGIGPLIYGDLGTHHETQLICGHFSFDRDAKHPLIDALPEYIHIKDYSAGTGDWMENTLKIIGSETGKDDMGSELIALKMSEIIYAQAMRTYLRSDEARTTVLSGYADERLAKAIKRIHQSPEHPWSLPELSQISGLSQSSFTNRFKEKLSMTPHRYLTQWRMQIARKSLKETNLSVIEIAEKIGYQSEAAFGRVFKKQFGLAPITYRNQ